MPLARLRAQHNVVDYFLTREAVRVNDAVRFTTTSPTQRRAFERLRDKDIVRTAGNDTWFLDIAAFERARKRRRNMVVAAGAAVGAGLLTALLRRRN